MYNGKHCPRGYSCIFLIGPAGNSACRAEKSIEWGQEQEKQEIMKKDHLILLAFLQRLMLGKKSLPKMKVMLRHNKHLYILFWWHEKKKPLPKSPQLKKLTWNYPYRQYICVSQTENKGSIKKKRVIVPLNVADCIPYCHLSLASRIQVCSCNGQHGVSWLWPKCWEDVTDHRVLQVEKETTTNFFLIWHWH